MKNGFLTATLAAGLVLASAAPVLAHGSMEPSHGGTVQMSGEVLVELVRNKQGLDVYLSEEDEPLANGEFDPSLIVTQASGAKSNVPLKPVGGNRYTAPGLKPGPGTKVVVVLLDKRNSAKSFASFRYN